MWVIGAEACAWAQTAAEAAERRSVLRAELEVARGELLSLLAHSEDHLTTPPPAPSSSGGGGGGGHSLSSSWSSPAAAAAPSSSSSSSHHAGGSSQSFMVRYTEDQERRASRRRQRLRAAEQEAESRLRAAESRRSRRYVGDEPRRTVAAPRRHGQLGGLGVGRLGLTQWATDWLTLVTWGTGQCQPWRTRWRRRRRRQRQLLLLLGGGGRSRRAERRGLGAGEGEPAAEVRLPRRAPPVCTHSTLHYACAPRPSPDGRRALAGSVLCALCPVLCALPAAGSQRGGCRSVGHARRGVGWGRLVQAADRAGAGRVQAGPAGAQEPGAGIQDGARGGAGRGGARHWLPQCWLAG
jgi:hypothetical protein